MVAAPVVLVLYALADILRGLTTSSWPLPLLSAAFGVTNSFASDRTGITIFVLTGHLIKLMSGVTALCLGEMSEKLKNDCLRSLIMVGSFGFGVVMGTCAFQQDWMGACPYVSIGMAYTAVMLWYEITEDSQLKHKTT